MPIRKARRLGPVLVAAALLGAPALQAQNVAKTSDDAAPGKPVVLDEIVAKVNTDIITLTDLQKEMDRLQISLKDAIKDDAQREKEFQKEKRGLLKNLIDNKLMLQKADELGIGASADADVASFLEEQRKQYGIPSMEVFDQVLKQKGTTLQDYRQVIKERMIIQRLIQEMVYSKLTVLTPEVKAYYQSHVADFTSSSQVDLSEIVFLTEGKDPAQVLKKAGDVLARLKKGASFEEMAKQYSEGPTAAQGGKIGKFKHGSLNSSIEKELAQLKKGEISGIIKTDYGYQILKVVDRVPAITKPFEEVRKQILQKIYEKKAQPELQAFVTNLRNESYVFVSPKYRKEFDVEEY